MASFQISNRKLDLRKQTEGASYFVTFLKDPHPPRPRKLIKLHKGIYLIIHTREGCFRGVLVDWLEGIYRRRGLQGAKGVLEVEVETPAQQVSLKLV